MCRYKTISASQLLPGNAFGKQMDYQNLIFRLLNFLLLCQSVFSFIFLMLGLKPTWK